MEASSLVMSAMWINCLVAAIRNSGSGADHRFAPPEFGKGRRSIVHCDSAETRRLHGGALGRNWPRQRRVAFSKIVSNTRARSPCDPLIRCSTSAVDVSRSHASLSSRVSRATSAPPTGWMREGLPLDASLRFVFSASRPRALMLRRLLWSAVFIASPVG